MMHVINYVGYIMGYDLVHIGTSPLEGCSPCGKETRTCLLKFAFITIHSLWQERNSRKHDHKCNDVAYMVCFIDKLLTYSGT